MPQKFLRTCINTLILSLFATTSIAAERLLPLQINTNKTNVGVWVVLEKDNQLYATKEALSEWRIIIDEKIPTISYLGETYYQLSKIDGYQVKLDPATQTANIDFSPQVYSNTNLINNNNEDVPKLSPITPSVFLNYDLSYTGAKVKFNNDFVQDLGMLGELGFSNEYGVFTNSFSTIKDRGVTEYSSNLYERIGYNRLETTFTKNFHETNQTLKIGDTSTNVAMLNRNVFFGGIQYGTNYNLRPGFITQPTPLLRGQSAAASTVELYINDVLRQTSEIPSGPFTVSNPALIGNGEARLVVRDQLGRETVITQSFTNNYQLLSENLTDWVVEGGKIRENLGLSTSSYGDFFVSGTYKKGINNNFTAVARGEFSENLQTLQGGVIHTLPLNMLGTFGAAASNDKTYGDGNQFFIGLEKTGLYGNAFIQYQQASKNYRQLGQLPENPTVAQQLIANLNFTTKTRDTFGIGYASIKTHENLITNQRDFGSNVNTYSATYTKPISSNLNLSIIGNKVTGDLDSYYVGLTLTYFLDQKKNISFYGTKRDDSHDLYATYNKMADDTDRLGYRLLAGQQENITREEAGIYYYGEKAVSTLDISNNKNQTTLRAGLSGALILADSTLFTTKKINQGFAVVDVSGYKDIGVGIGNNYQTKTDSNGKAIITNLTPYQNNQIRLNPSDLPISAEVNSIETYVVPAIKTASKATFPVRTGQGAVIHLLFDDNQDAPPGAVVNILNETEDFYVGRNGKVFVTGLQLENQLVLDYNGKKCQFSVKLKEKSDDEIQRISGIVCKGVPR